MLDSSSAVRAAVPLKIANFLAIFHSENSFPLAMVTVKSTLKTSAPSQTELSPSDAVFLSHFLDLFLTYSLVILQLFG